MVKEESIKTLNINYNDILRSRSEKIKRLEQEEHILKVKFLKVKKRLKIDLAADETKLRFLTACSSGTLEYLENLLPRSHYILSLSDTCVKLETEREKIIKWLPITEFVAVTNIEKSLTDDEKLYQRAVQKSFSLPRLKELESGSFTQSTLSDDLTKSRPITGITRTFPGSETTEPDIMDSIEKPHFEKIAPIEEIKLEARKSDEQELQDDIPEEQPTILREKDFLDHCSENLEKMEHFWKLYNKVEIDVLELKEERSALEKENKQLRGFIRAVLEAAALSKSIPESGVSTRVPSQRGAYSAPLRRIVFN